MKFLLFVGVGGFLAAFGSLPQFNLFASDQTFIHLYGLGDNYLNQATTNNVPFSYANSGNGWSVRATAGFGRSSVALDETCPPTLEQWETLAADWSDTVTIQPDDPTLEGTSGTANFNYHVNGFESVTLDPSGANEVYYQIDDAAWGDDSDGVGPGGQDLADGKGMLPPLSSVATFTMHRSFTFGAPFSFVMGMNAWVRLAPVSAGTFHAMLAAGVVTVQDQSGNPVGYTFNSSAGFGRATIVTNGVSYAGLAATNTLGSRTSLALLDGRNDSGSNEVVALTFLTSPNTNQIISDVADLSGTGTNLFVVQMNFNPQVALAHLGSASNAVLLWFDQAAGKWVDAVDGNADGGLTRRFFLGAFNPATEFHPGDFGVDTTNDVAWAVVNHNSEYAVGAPTPALRLTGVSAGTNETALAMSGPAKAQYMIQESPDLSAGSWSTIGMVTLSTNGVGSFTDTNAVPSVHERFYRLRQ